jgi:hypothetical protein
MSKVFLNNIAEHLKNEKSKKAIEELVGALDAKRDLVLPKVLQEKLDKVGNNPLEAKEVDEKAEEINKKIADGEFDNMEANLDLIEAVLTSNELVTLYEDGVSLAEFELLGKEISNKVFYHKYLDENNNYVFKEVDSHKEMEILSYFERKEIRTISKKIDSLQNKLAQITQKGISLIRKSEESQHDKIVDDTQEEMEKIKEKTKPLIEELKEKAFKYAKLEKKDMTEWEQGLLVAKVEEMAEDRYTPPKGKN